ncbi:MAG: response regulator transcription factor [Sulfuricella denitrificans]|nr:response regulator transcription factor [Sulfuricella denitrificans]
MIRLIITDDHAIVRHGLKQILALAPDIEVAGEAGDGQELLDLLGRTDCGLVLLDMNMPGISGMELIGKVRASYPEIPILVLSMHIEGSVASRALKAGAAGYLTKDSEPEALVAAIRKVAAGGRFIDPVMVETLVFDGDADSSLPHQRLSERELQVFTRLVAGETVSEIADKLFLSVKTISTHKFRLMQKMKLQTTSDLVRYAVRHGLIEG